MTALNADGLAINSAAERLHSTGAATRALYLTSSALAGAVLYLLVTWPHPHAQVQANSQRPAAATPAQPLARVPVVPARQPAGLAEFAVMESVRAVVGSAQAREAAIIETQSQAPVASTSGPSVAAVAASTGSSGAQTAVTTAATESTVVAVTSGALAGAGIDARQPAISNVSPNRIGVPGSQPSSFSSIGSPTTGGANRISIPATPPR